MGIAFVGDGKARVTTASAAVSLPVGCQVGDFLLLFSTNGWPNPGALNNLVHESNDSGANSEFTGLHWKFLTSQEVSEGVTSFFQNGYDAQCVASVYRGVDPLTPFDVAPALVDLVSSGTSLSVPAVVTTVANSWIVYLFGSRAGNNALTISVGTTRDNANNTDSAFVAADLATTTAGSQGSGTVTSAGSGGITGYTMALKEASVALRPDDSTVSYVGGGSIYSATATATITLPTLLAQDVIMIQGASDFGISQTQPNGQSGFTVTSGSTSSGSNITGKAWTKVADGTESGTTIGVTSGGGPTIVDVAVYRNTTVLSAATQVDTAGAATKTTAAVSSVPAGSRVVYIGYNRNSYGAPGAKTALHNRRSEALETSSGVGRGSVVYDLSANPGEQVDRAFATSGDTSVYWSLTTVVLIPSVPGRVRDKRGVVIAQSAVSRSAY